MVLNFALQFYCIIGVLTQIITMINNNNCVHSIDLKKLLVIIKIHFYNNMNKEFTVDKKTITRV